MPGFKNFRDLQILKAENVNDYLMKQAVISCFTELDRDLALSSVLREGMVCFIKDTEQIIYYDGENWKRVATFSEATAGFSPRRNEVILQMDPRETTIYI